MDGTVTGSEWVQMRGNNLAAESKCEFRLETQNKYTNFPYMLALNNDDGQSTGCLSCRSNDWR